MRWFRLFFILIIRNIKWFFIKLFSKDDEIMRDIQGSKMILLTSKKGMDLKEDNIFKQLILDREREFEATKVLKQIIKPGNVIFELGANIGYYSLLESGLVGELGKIYAVEPEINNFNLLKRNIELNKIKNIEIFNLAISDKSGEFPFYISENSNLHSMVKPRQGNYRTIIIKALTVDYFLRDKGKIDFLRMDIEGYEYQALIGMKKTLESNQNLKLFIELHSNLINTEKTIEFLNTLKAYNFEILVAISHDNYMRRFLGKTKVEEITIDKLKNDPRVLNRECAFEIFFYKRD